MALASKRVVMVASIAAAGTALFFAGMYAARAKPGGETRKTLSFAGRVTGVTGAQTMTFSFKKDGATLCEPKVTATPDASGAFSVDIPLSACPGALFDGSDVLFDVSIGSTVVAKDQAVSPVPYARYADLAGSPDCPVGYSRDASISAFVLCARGGDEVVKVGSGNSAFWIDRYEASVWSSLDGAGTQYGASGADYPATFPPNGQYATPLFAVSRAGVLPSRYLTWFQATEACAVAGKRLPSNSEWTRAARGTPDPSVDSDGTAGSCATKSAAPHKAGEGGACASAWGAQDMVGNAWELVDEWMSAVGNADTAATPWPTGFGGDYSGNIVSKAYALGASVPVGGIASAVIRGGSSVEGVLAGVFALSAHYSPASATATIGFRCLTPR